MKRYQLKMRIKTFKLFESDEYYQEMGEAEYSEIFFNNDDIEERIVGFKKGDFDYIRSFLPKGYSISKVIGEMIYINKEGGIGKYQIETCVCTITKLKDEWYVLSNLDKEKSEEEVYKCDQLEGLKKCFLDKCV
jgi:hypothetical protein